MTDSPKVPRPGLRVTYDPLVDALAIALVPGARHARAVRIQPNVIAHFDAARRLVEVEILGASAAYSAAELAAFGGPVDWLTLKEAAAEAGLAAGTLRVLIRNGKLPAVKRGHDWHVGRAALWTYLENRDPRGRPSPRAPRPRKKLASAS
jgi:excisionase family DNA binding protein